MTKQVDVMYHTDKHGSVTGYVGAMKVAAVWGPAVDNGEWFLAIQGQEPRRVATKDEALMLLPVRWPATTTEEGPPW